MGRIAWKWICSFSALVLVAGGLTMVLALPAAAAEPVLVSPPTISGVAQVGMVLTSTDAVWSQDGFRMGPTSKVWDRCSGTDVSSCVAIGNGSGSYENGKTYTVTTADVGFMLRVCNEFIVTIPSWARYDVWSAPTATVVAGALTLTSTPVPVVSDSTPVAGQALTVNPGTWGPAPVQLTFQWFRGATAIPGATGEQYVVQAADVGSSLKVQVTGSKTGYLSVSKTSAATAVVAKGVVSPTPTPKISDTTPVTDQMLATQSGTWGPGGVILKYQWYRRSPSGKVKSISGATRDTYQVRASDVRYKLRVKVTGSLPGAKSVAKVSAWTSKVAKAKFITAPSPTVSGVVQVGMPLTVAAGTWKPTAKLKYQWYRVSNSGKKTTIRKATKATYTPKAADKGRRLNVRVTAYRSGYVTTTRYSPVTIKV
jgi:hypothetical protein